MVPPANHWLLGNHVFFLPLYLLGFAYIFLYSILQTPQFHKASNLPFDYSVIHVQVCHCLRGFAPH